MSINLAFLKYPTKHRDHLMLGLLVICSIIVWCIHLGDSDISGLLAGEVYFSRESIYNIIFNMKWGDQSPIYFLLLHFWRMFSEAEFWIRYLSVFANALSAVVMYKISYAQFRNSKTALICVLLYVVSPFCVSWTRSARIYPTLYLLMLITIYYLFKYLAHYKISDLVKFSIFLTLSVYTHFIGFWFIVLILIYLFVLYILRSITFKTAFFFFIAFTVMFFLTLPNIIRAHLFFSGNTQNVFTMSDNFWIFTEGVTRLAVGNPRWVGNASLNLILKTIFSFSALIIFLYGILRAPKKLKIFIIIWTFGSTLSIFGIHALTEKLDFRVRYLGYYVPVAIIAMAYGATCQIQVVGLRPQLLRTLNYLRNICVGIVIIGMACTSSKSIYDKSDRWSFVMKSLDRVYHSNMALYFYPFWTVYAAQYQVEANGLNPELMNFKSISRRGRKRLIEDVGRKKDIALFLADEDRGGDFAWMLEYLKDHDYERIQRIKNGSLYVRIYSQRKTENKRASKKIIKNIPSPKVLFGQNMTDLVVYRTGQDKAKRPAYTFLPDELSAAKMHEDKTYPDTGWVSHRWMLGENDWDSVGYTRQRSGNEPRFGIWAHPLDETVLNIDIKNVKLKEKIKGFAGLTDYAIKKAAGMGVFAPIDFKLFIGEEKVLEKAFPREHKWQEIEFSTQNYSGQIKDLHIEISSRSQRWAHFIFDLQAE